MVAVPFAWEVQPEGTSYFGQAGIQHSQSYPVMLGVPELNSVINRGESISKKMVEMI